MPQPDTVDTLLELQGNAPQTIYVRYFPQKTATGGTEDKVGFALQEGGLYHLRGLHWHNHPPKPDSVAPVEKNVGSGKFLALVLEAPLIDVDCDLHYSPTTTQDTRTHVQMCIPSGNFKATYHFVVDRKDPQLGTRRLTGIDPLIVVTPITQPTA